ncbi:hypothetical protein BC834DRAFT_973142 [Gloeopeniophorella convolvens]|nr:hypothetical protein BC834DRAFT_973142 [Gloeopeniophorella convolvens]
MSQSRIGDGRIIPTSVGPGINGNSTVPPSGAPASKHDGSNFTHGSGSIFTIFLEKAAKDDDRMTESWKGDADSTLVFTGLFVATVAIIISHPSLT